MDTILASDGDDEESAAALVYIFPLWSNLALFDMQKILFLGLKLLHL